MNVGELFVKLGIKGGDKTLSTLQANQKAFKGTASMALEAKAAIFGAIYALQSLFRTSNTAGSDLQNFNSTLGVSAQTLQRYQYAARQVGVDNKAVEASFRGLQATMTKTLMGEGAPKGLARVAQLTGDLTPDDLMEFSKAPEKLLQRLQEYASKEKDAGFRTEVLKSFGLGDDMVAALNRQAFRPEVLNKAPTYSDKEIGALDKANVAWSNLGNKIEMAIGRFNAKYGVDIVKGISDITDQVMKLADALMLLSEKLKLFETLKDVIDAITFVTGAGATTVDIAGGKAPSPEKYKKMNRESDEFLSKHGFIDAIVKTLFGEDKTAERIEMMQKAMEKARAGYQQTPNGPLLDPSNPMLPVPIAVPPSLMPRAADAAVPRMPPSAGQAGPNVSNQNVTINQTLQFPGATATDPEKAKRVHGEAVQKAYRQMSAQTRSN